jgi:hypothetical protein
MERTRHRLKRSAEPAGGRRRAGSIRHSLAGNAANLPRQRHKPKPKNLPFAQGLLATSLKSSFIYLISKKKTSANESRGFLGFEDLLFSGKPLIH